MKIPKTPRNGMYIELGHQILPNTANFPVEALERLNDRYWMFKSDCPSLDQTYNLVSLSANRVRYSSPAAQRAAAHIMSNTECVLTGFGALALYGLPFMVDGTDTVLANPRTVRKIPPGRLQPSVVRTHFESKEVWTVSCGSSKVQIVTPAVATAQALRLIRLEKVTWSAHGGAEVDATFVRAVQLVDAVRRFLNVDAYEIIRAGNNRVNERWLLKVIKASSRVADSPKETEMRFLAVQFAAKHGFTLVEQLPLYREEKLVTVFDLALIEPRIGIMYDGSHHNTRDQLVKDNMIDIDAAAERWTPVRFRLETLPRFFEKLESLI
ncbi:hypothetical protein [Corynebacterium stercoris]|nr:hypothetical protein [Corynebacterium stercoris]